MSKPVLAELLRFIAANEDLPRTLVRYPGYTRDVLGKLISAAADRVEQAEGSGPEAAPGGPSKGLRVRRATEVEKAARQSAEELESAMNESKVERERKKKDRAAAAEKEREQEREREVARPLRTRLYTDGAARGNPGPAGAGAVIINENGHVVAKVGKYLGETTNNVAEYTGMILGLRRAKAMGLRSLDVFADSELVVKQLNGEYQVKAEHLLPLYEEARALLKGFSEIEIRYIPREENAQADEMSNRAIDLRL
ncbi:MAG TPA: ribonuclease HI family protein [Anaeromyxobacteraceae bacterium]|nr:ribonuclease HI family protein [Anaeromyxobacteraceae bacterium]